MSMKFDGLIVYEFILIRLICQFFLLSEVLYIATDSKQLNTKK